MVENWVNNLDMCAQNGIINYDAAAFVKGQAPRYIGNPQGNISPLAEIPDAPLMTQPKTDEFKRIDDEFKQDAKENKDNSPIPFKIPTWKKLAFGALAIGGLVFAGIKCKSAIQWIVGKFKKP